MPELPDVESFRRFFHRHAAGRNVRGVVVTDAGVLRNVSPRTLHRALRGRRLADPARRGKWLICPSDGPTLLLHFGMTGELIWSAHEPQRHPHDRVILQLDGGEIRYRDLRKLGGVWLAHDDRELDSIIGHLGPDALGVDHRELLDRLARRRGGIKAALLDQRFLAGVGNLLADEILWQARIHPRHNIGDLGPEERSRLHRTLRRVVRGSIGGPGLNRRGWLGQVRGDPDARCPRCRTPLRRAEVAGRTTWLCPRCQPGIRPRAKTPSGGRRSRSAGGS